MVPYYESISPISKALDKAVLFRALADPEPQIRKAAVWMSELYLRQNDQQVISRLSAMVQDPSPEVRVQLAGSPRTNQAAAAQAAVSNILAANPDHELIQASHAAFVETHKRIAAEKERVKNLSPEERELVQKGSVIYKQLCANCHGPEGKGIQVGNRMPAPPLAGSPRLRGSDRILPVQIMLHGPSTARNTPI